MVVHIKTDAVKQSRKTDRELARGDIYVPEPGKSTGSSVAVIGTGPAGLSAAYFLRLAGHRVIVWTR